MKYTPMLSGFSTYVKSNFQMPIEKIYMRNKEYVIDLDRDRASIENYNSTQIRNNYTSLEIDYSKQSQEKKKIMEKKRDEIIKMILNEKQKQLQKIALQVN